MQLAREAALLFAAQSEQLLRQVTQVADWLAVQSAGDD